MTSINADRFFYDANKTQVYHYHTPSKPGSKKPRRYLELSKFTSTSNTSVAHGTHSYDEFKRSQYDNLVPFAIFNLPKDSRLGQRLKIAAYCHPFYHTGMRYFECSFRTFVEKIFMRLKDRPDYRIFTAIVVPDRPVHLYFDMDSQDSVHLEPGALQHVLPEFERHLIRFFEIRYNRKPDLSGLTYFICSRPGVKLSAHAHITTEAFLSHEDLRNFIEGFLDYLKQSAEDDVRWLIKSEHKNGVLVKDFVPIDRSVYNKHSLMRMYGNCKPQYGIHLKALDATLVRNEHDEAEMLWRSLPNYSLPDLATYTLLQYEKPAARPTKRRATKRRASETAAVTTEDTSGVVVTANGESNLSRTDPRKRARPTSAVAAKRLGRELSADDLNSLQHIARRSRVLGANTCIASGQLQASDTGVYSVFGTFKVATVPCVELNTGFHHHSNRSWMRMTQRFMYIGCLDPDCSDKSHVVLPAWWSARDWQNITRSERSGESAVVEGVPDPHEGQTDSGVNEEERHQDVEAVGNVSELRLTSSESCESPTSFTYSDRYVYNKHKETLDRLFRDHPFTTLGADMSTGKTQFILSGVVLPCFRDNRKLKALWFSGKRAYARNIEARLLQFAANQNLHLGEERLGIGNYLRFRADKQGCEDLALNNVIIISMESLPRLAQMRRLDYDLVIIDEVVEILANTQSQTMTGKRLECLGLFERILTKAKRICAADADYQRETTEPLLKAFSGGRAFFHIQNHHQPFADRQALIYESREHWAVTLQQYVQKKKKICISTNSRRKALMLQSLMLEWVQALNATPPYRILVIHGLSSDADKDAAVKGSWKQYDVFIYTPFIGQGVDFSDKHFDVSFLYAINGSTTARQTYQQMNRFRHFSESTVHVFLDLKRCNEQMYPVRPADIRNLTVSQLNRWKRCGGEYAAHAIDWVNLPADDSPEMVYPLVQDKHTDLFIMQQMEANESRRAFDYCLIRSMHNNGIQIRQIPATAAGVSTDACTSMRTSIQQATARSKRSEIEQLHAAGGPEEPSPRTHQELLEKQLKGHASAIDKQIIHKASLCKLYGVEWSQLTLAFLDKYANETAQKQYERYTAFLHRQVHDVVKEAADHVQHRVDNESEMLEKALPRFVRTSDVHDLLDALQLTSIESTERVIISGQQMQEEYRAYSAQSTSVQMSRTEPLLSKLKHLAAFRSLYDDTAERRLLPQFTQGDPKPLENKVLAGIRSILRLLGLRFLKNKQNRPKLRRRSSTTAGSSPDSTTVSPGDDMDVEAAPAHSQADLEKRYKLDHRTWKDVVAIQKRMPSA